MIRDMIRIGNQEIAPTIAAIANNNNPMTNTHSDQFKALLFMSIAFSCDSTMTRSAFIASTCICRTSLAPIIPMDSTGAIPICHHPCRSTFQDASSDGGESPVG